MLCKLCEWAIYACFDALAANTSKKKHQLDLHHSLLSFYKSIESGCFICRQVRAEILGYNQERYEVGYPDSSRHFRLQLRAVEAAAVQAGYSQRDILPSSNPLTRKAKQTIIWLTQHALPLPPSHYYAKLSRKEGAAQYWDGRSELILSDSNINRMPYLSIRTRTLTGQEWGFEFNFCPVSRDNIPASPYSARDFEVYGTSTASMPELWRYWFRNCSESHTHCRALEKKAFSPYRLVQILSNEEDRKAIKWRLSIRGDIDRDAEHVAYLTLSHCWGVSPTTKLEKTTYFAFQKYAGTSELPKTYQHALDITVSLGFRYLWIDSLCIFQDDEDDWREQASVMGSIYSNARCNIAATWASDIGQGCFSDRDPSAVTSTTVLMAADSSMPIEYHLSRHAMYSDDINDAPLNSRCWVVQERWLAAKQLSFTKQQVYWECSELVASEQFPHGLPNTIWSNDVDSRISPPTAKPRLDYDYDDELHQSWASLVATYSYGNLTRPSDKMIALAGLADEFRKRTKDVYLAGLWKANLHKQLCWRPDPDLVGYVNTSRTSEYHAPTWSWANLNGLMCFDSRYHSPERKYVYFIRVLNASVKSTSPSGLHSFSLGALEVQGIALWTDVAPTDEGDRYNVRFIETEKQKLLLDMDRAFEIYFDENLTKAEAHLQSRRWHSIQKQRSSSFLFMFVACRSPKWWAPEAGRNSDELEGLILKKKANGKFIRMGTFFNETCCDKQLRGLITSRLGLQKNASLMDGINLEDPRLADLVHRVIII